MFARGWIELARKNTLALPVSAVRTDRAKPYAIRITTGKSETVELGLGLRGQAGAANAGQDMVEVLTGLNEGDQVLAASAGLVPGGVVLRIMGGPNAVANASPVSSAATSTSVR